jgi:hypothetical protein
MYEAKTLPCFGKIIHQIKFQYSYLFIIITYNQICILDCVKISETLSSCKTVNYLILCV